MNRLRVSGPIPWLPVVCLVATLILGAYVRLTGLGDADFHEDELDHYYGALSMAAGSPPLLPSGNEYDRALDYTRLVRLALPLSERPEMATRIPGALFGILSLVIIAGFAWTVGGPWCAVVATLLLAVYPSAVIESRRVRFYSYQLALILGAMWAGWYAIRPRRADPSPDASATRGRWIALVLTLGLFALAARVQVTSLSVMAAWLTACAWAAWTNYREGGPGALKWNLPATVLGGALLAGVVAAAFRPGLIGDLWSSATSVPAWAGTGPGDVRTYFWYLTDTYPVLLSLGSVLAIIALVRHRALGIYLLCWFGVPLFLHTFVFAWKASRFVLGAMPGLFLIAGLVVPSGVAALRQATASIFPERLKQSRVERLASAVVVGFICLFAVASTPGFNETRRIPPSHQELGWSAARSIIDSLDLSNTTVIGAATPFQALHYLPRTDFTVSQFYFDSATPSTRLVDGVMEQVSLDFYVGVPILTTPASIEASFPEADSILVLVDSTWAGGNVDPTLRDVLIGEASELCRGRCLELQLFLWQPQPRG